ncbi:MAG TPA: hypothetical protein PKD86_07745 [Gemmatales bacterium]|nr:hypothetical protein [Gemmatales bacterium]HMP59230.1 hypothetical protein [Gemmatales bacterium]
MTQIVLEMKFSCCRCEAPTIFVVHCHGAGLMAGDRTTLTARVPCYHCGCKHAVNFHPTGMVVAAEPVESEDLLLVPSVN